tara:strand:+ start:1728 stop:2060 length:333 start_codon:yes stop_codon:yes gene_type:complete
MEFLSDLWFSLTYRLKRAFYFSFKRLKWFLHIKEPPLISVELQEMPSEMLGGIEGMLFIKWQRERKMPEAFQLQSFEFQHLLESSKKQTFQTLPADVEKVLKEKYGEKNA